MDPHNIDYFGVSIPTFMNNWNPFLMQHSIPTEIIMLGLDEKRAMFLLTLPSVESLVQEKGDEEASRILSRASTSLLGSDSELPLEVSPRLGDKISSAIEKLGGEVFVRLTTRSPKDSWTGFREGFKVKDAKGALRLLCDSERSYEDLSASLSLGHDIGVAVRQWVDIDPMLEFRVIKSGMVLCISQYNYLKKEELDLSKYGLTAGDICWGVSQMEEVLRPMIPTHCVFDVFMDPKTRKMTLIEINPYGHFTDGCLFKWDEPLNIQEFRHFGPGEQIIKNGFRNTR